MAPISSSTLNSLPTELLEEILSHLHLKQLIQITTTSQQIHASVTYIIQQRFRNLSNLNGHHLIFECSLPSHRRATPYHTCNYDGVSPVAAKQEVTPSSMYACFTPRSGDGLDRVCKTLPFDTSVYFTQLISSAVLAERVCGITSVVSVIPETVFRIRRQWLREAAKTGEVDMLWLDEGENVGMRLRVREVQVQARRRELLVFQREEEEGEKATSFEVAFEEVCVRMGYLVGRVEEAEKKEVVVLR